MHDPAIRISFELGYPRSFIERVGYRCRLIFGIVIDQLQSCCHHAMIEQSDEGLNRPKK